MTDIREPLTISIGDFLLSQQYKKKKKNSDPLEAIICVFLTVLGSKDDKCHVIMWPEEDAVVQQMMTIE